MKAKLQPLQGKYYGTFIEIDFKDGGDVELIKLWDNTIPEPSVREIEESGETAEEYLKSMYNDHYESKLTYERACKLVDLINNYEK